jgi:glycosyltransferase involved in cell wall biosynthesis
MQPQQQDAAPLQVSVLIVSRNCASALRRTIEALEKAPDRPLFEVLVVDNGSRDGSQSMDSEFPGVTMLRLPHMLGITKARNIGIRTAKGEFLLLVEPGVVMRPASVSALAARLDAEPTALAVCPVLEDATGKVVSTARLLPTPAGVKTHWRDPYSLPSETVSAGPVQMHDGKAILLRKNTIQGINYFDERYGNSWIDAELAFQIHRAGRRILMVPECNALLTPLDARPDDKAVIDADRAAGAAAYIGKRAGFLAGLLFMAGLTIRTLLGMLTFTDLNYKSGLLMRLLSGGKIDGTDTSL